MDHAKMLLEVAATAGPRTRSQSRTRDSSLSTAPLVGVNDNMYASIER
jgi:hypothetical protein